MDTVDISTSKLNNWLKLVTLKHQHPLINNKKVNFKYIVKTKNNPLTIKIFNNFGNKLKKNYKTYLLNDFNNYFKILNQKTKIVFSKSDNPYIN